MTVVSATRSRRVAAKMPKTTTKATPDILTDDDQAVIDAVAARFTAVTSGGVALYATAASGLWTLFLDSIPKRLRQIYTCHACRTFVERYGGLVSIAETGEQITAVWDASLLRKGSPFVTAFEALGEAVERAKVTGPYVAKEATWGQPVTGAWRHFAVMPPKQSIHRHPILTAGQVMAERREDRGTLSRALADFGIDVARNARHLLASGDALYRSEKVLGVAEWFVGLHEALAATKNKRHRENIVWRAVATAPPGFCHIRSTMIGTLLEDIQAGLDFEDIKRRFASKMHPLQYQRPTAAPGATQIAQAEAAVAALNAAGSLERRFATLADMKETLWTPKAVSVPPAATGGVFGHLKPKAAQAPPTVDAGAQVVTWAKFRRDVLPTADRLEYRTIGVDDRFIALVTAVNPDAPPILQWDRDEYRNPVSWYIYMGGARAAEFNLAPNDWVEVDAVVALPPMWGGTEPRPHWGEGAILILRGAKDVSSTRRGGGRGFFPEQLRSEFHPYRATLEAYTESAIVAGIEGDCAAGIDIRKGDKKMLYRVRVTTGGLRAVYDIDRWE